MKKWLIVLTSSTLALAIAGCTSAVPTPTPTLTPSSTATPAQTPTPTPTPSPIKEWNLDGIQVDGSTIKVRLHVFAGIDVRATLDGKDPEQVNALIPKLEFVFENVAPGKHTIQVSDVVGHEETSEVVVPTPGMAHCSYPAAGERTCCKPTRLHNSI